MNHLTQFCIVGTCVLICACSKPDDPDPLAGIAESDCINLCANGSPIPSNSAEPCECECEEPFYGPTCADYDEPDGFLLNSIHLVQWPELYGDEPWDTGSGAEILPDFKILIYTNDGNTLLGETSVIPNIVHGSNPVFLGDPFPLYIPFESDIQFAIYDVGATSAESDFNVLLIGERIMDQNIFFLGNSFDLAWMASSGIHEGSIIKIRLTGSWQ